MYHVFLKDDTQESFAHPTVSQVIAGERHIWQMRDEVEVLVASYPTASVRATVDCSCSEAECSHVEEVKKQLNPPIVDPVKTVRAKLGVKEG